MFRSHKICKSDCYYYYFPGIDKCTVCTLSWIDSWISFIPGKFILSRIDTQLLPISDSRMTRWLLTAICVCPDKLPCIWHVTRRPTASNIPCLCNWFAFRRKKLLCWSIRSLIDGSDSILEIWLPVPMSTCQSFGVLRMFGFLNITLKRPVSTSKQVGTSRRTCVINSYRMTCKWNPCERKCD